MVWAFDKHKTDKSGRHLVVYLSPCMATLTKILMQSTRKHLFVNEDGQQWKQDTVSMTMRRLRQRLGIDAITVYAYRHSFATDALLAGNSLAVVAELLGHSDTRMVGKVYGHLDQQKSHLLDAVNETAKKRLG
jgi:site-specific recombinase XerD